MSTPDYTSVILDLIERRDQIDATIKALLSLAPTPGQKHPPNASPGPQDFADMERGDAAHALLEETGQPMTPREIVGQLLARGFQTNAKKPEESMRSALRRGDRFRRMGLRGAWGLVEWDLTPAEEDANRKRVLELIGVDDQIHTYTMICHGAGTCSCHCHHEDPTKIVPDCGCWDEVAG